MGESVTGGAYINVSATGKPGAAPKGEAHLIEVFFYNQANKEASRASIELLVNTIKLQAESCDMKVDIYLDNVLVTGAGGFQFP